MTEYHPFQELVGIISGSTWGQVGIISGSVSFRGWDHFEGCTVPALSVYFKRSFNKKMESYTKPTVTSPNF